MSAHTAGTHQQGVLTTGECRKKDNLVHKDTWWLMFLIPCVQILLLTVDRENFTVKIILQSKQTTKILTCE